MLILNRVYSVGGYKFNYWLIKGGFYYLVENYIICVKYTNEINDLSLIEKYEQIISSFKLSKTSEFIQLYFSNNATINTKELNYLFPIYK